MNEIRRIISLFVGLIVVLLVIAYAFGKMGFYGKNTTVKTGGSLAGLFGKKEMTTPPPAGGPNASKKITIKQVVDGDTTKVKTVTTNAVVTPTTTPKRVVTPTTQPVTSIPEAGATTAALPLAASALFAGVYLRRKI